MKKRLGLWLAAALLLAFPLVAAEINNLSVTDANNTGRFPEGMTFANVNDSARALEGILARWHRDTNGSLTTTGSANAYVLAANQVLTSYYTGLRLTAKANFTSTGAATLNVDALGARSIAGSAAGTIVSGVIYDFVFDGTNFQILSGASVPAGSKAVFVQAGCPVGWTQDTTNNDRALRLVSGTGGGTGGTTAFSTVFASRTPAGTVGNTTLTANQIPAHQHFIAASATSAVNLSNTTTLATFGQAGDGESKYLLAGDAAAATLGLSSSVGGGQAHNHSFTGNAMDFAVNFVNVIVCTKN